MPNKIAEAVIATARAQIGKPYQIGAEGPDKFDCSGLVYYAFNQNGQDALIGGGRHRARWYERWCQAHGQFSPSVGVAERGDLVFYGHDAVTHIGIYLGPRRQRVISALINPWGVSRHRLNGITVPVIGFGLIDYAQEDES